MTSSPPKINEEKSRPWVHTHQGHPTSIFENICSEDDLRSRIFGTFVVKFFAGPLLPGFSNILKNGTIIARF